MTLFLDRTRYKHYPIIALFKEIATLLLLGIAIMFVYVRYADFEIATETGIRWIPVVFSLSPVLFLYILLRLPLGSSLAAIVSLACTGILIAINDFKAALTGAPLSWSDMTSTDNIALSSTFLATWVLVVIAVVIVLLTIVLWRLSRKQLANRSWRSALIHIAALLVISPIALQPYVVDFSPKTDAKLMDALNRYGIMYFSWDWSENIRMNGLPMHLLQTSHRSVPAMPTAKDYQAFTALAPTSDDDVTPKHVFFILCEACWYDDTHFTEMVHPLAKQGFTAMRGISPAYGGGTANAAFEMLTSLPSRGALQGIIYQEYATMIGKETLTIPSMMREKGYQTFALHNFSKTFWQRDVVMEKLGFDDFLGIEDMDYDGPTYYPRDTVLYKSTMDILKKNINNKVFFNLETVYSHASYDTDDDDGQKDYAKRLSVTMQDLAKFITDVRRISPNALFVVYGDHKPILTKYFYDEGVLPADMFIATGDNNGDFSFAHNANQEILGDVPVWIGSTNAALTQQVVTAANNKPFYCVSAAIDDLFLVSQNPASRYAMAYACPDFSPGQYRNTAKSIPSWLYALSLFDPKNKALATEN
jgi:phosphoglycerol transferase MdoB-like AlkP superfamily enzyme